MNYSWLARNDNVFLPDVVRGSFICDVPHVDPSSSIETFGRFCLFRDVDFPNQAPATLKKACEKTLFPTENGGYEEYEIALYVAKNLYGEFHYYT